MHSNEIGLKSSYEAAICVGTQDPHVVIFMPVPDFVIVPSPDRGFCDPNVKGQVHVIGTFQ